MQRTFLFMALGLGLAACSKTEPPPAPPKAAAIEPTPSPSPTQPPALSSLAQSVKGRWRRDDGGYVLEIRGVDPSGTLEAHYFNPKPIHVSRAAWREGGGRLQLLIELNDVGYAGSTYILAFDPGTNRLVGQYTQPSLQQTFDIEFSRALGP